MNNKLIKLEAIRGFAALYVVFHHTIHQFRILNFDLSFLFRFGQEAVILFFILSGFVIEYSYSKGKDKSFKTYFLKRFLRIYIPLFFVFITHFIIKSINTEVNIDWRILFGNIFMLQDVGSLKPNVIVPTFLGNSPLWSLSYEWWFYMLYFPLITFFKKKSSLIVYTLGVISALTYIIYPNFFNRELMYLTIWWSGVEIARLYSQGKTINLKNLKYSLLVLTVITVILGVNVYLSKNISTIGVHPILELRHFGFSLVAIFLALVWKKLRWIGFSPTIEIFSRFAPISYGVYISHYFLITGASYLDNIIHNNILKYILYISICLGFSYLIERIIYVKIARIVKKAANNV
jgi:peptidoglycan/LPS O-acetylase OafA/YrhL